MAMTSSSSISVGIDDAGRLHDDLAWLGWREVERDGAIVLAPPTGAGPREVGEDLRTLISHDMASPVRALTLIASLIEAKGADVDSALLATVPGEAERVMLVTRRFSEFMKLLLRVPRFVERPLADVVAAAVRARRDRDVEVDVAEGLTTRLDEVLVESAVSELLDNARLHAPGGHRVTARAEADGVVLEVADAGPGIPAEYREAMLRAGRRLCHDDVPGCGLGLAVCAHVAACHGGRVEISAGADGAGCTVRMRLANGGAA